MRGRESFLTALDHRLSRIAAWVAERRRGGEHAGVRGLHTRTEALREEVARARRGIRELVHQDLARVRASLDDMARDYDAPPAHHALRRRELEALRRHLHTTARLTRDLSVADSPRWTAANAEYERSWEEVERAFEGEGDAAAP